MVRLGFTKVTATALRDAGRQGDQSESEPASGAEGPAEAGVGPTLEYTSNVSTGFSLLPGRPLSSACFPGRCDKDLLSTCLAIFRLIFRGQPGTFHPTLQFASSYVDLPQFLHPLCLPTDNCSVFTPTSGHSLTAVWVLMPFSILLLRQL